MAYWHISPWMKMLYPSLVWDHRAAGNTLYLTFDDGPTPGITEKVLDTLDVYRAKATFFCVGRNAERHPELFAEILKRKHAVGNHTYSHIKGWKNANDDFFGDIELADKIIGSKLFRPPYGQIRRSQIAYLKKFYKIVMWDVISHDYEQRISKERSLKAVLKYTKQGSILVFHDSNKAYNKLNYILPAVLEHFSERGYVFKPIFDQD
jgi:peptidoglycan/xylan/chitin deacetylase (PgdA/CDA1 family)